MATASLPKCSYSWRQTPADEAAGRETPAAFLRTSISRYKEPRARVQHVETEDGRIRKRARRKLSAGRPCHTTASAWTRPAGRRRAGPPACFALARDRPLGSPPCPLHVQPRSALSAPTGRDFRSWRCFLQSLFWGERARSLDHPFLHGCVANLVSREGGGWGESVRGKGRKMSGRIQPANRGSLCRACVLLPSTSPRRRQTEGQTDRQTRPGGSRVSAVEVHGLLPVRVFIPPDDLSPIRPISIKRRLYTGLALSRWHTAAIEPKAPALLGSTSGTEGTDFKQGKDIKYLV